MIPAWQVGAAALALGLLAGGAAGYRYADGRAAKVVVKAMTAEEARRLKAYDALAAANSRLTAALDAAAADLEAVRQQQPKTLIKTVVKTVEVPSGATTVDCPVPSLGDDFLRLYNDAAGAYAALPRAD